MLTTVRGARSDARARKAIRILSAVGPGDVVTAFNDWKKGRRTLSETAITFSSQEFDFFKTHDIPFWVVASHPRRERLNDGASRVENRPRVTTRPVSGIRFHCVQLLYALSLFGSAIRFRATHAIIDSGTAPWFAFGLFHVFGIKVIPNFHNACWIDGDESQSAVKRALWRLDSLFFKRCVRFALGVSPDGHRQMSVISGGRVTFVEYRAQFVRDDFAELPQPVLTVPMRIMFAGRVEEGKGVFDILTICEILSARQPNRFVFDICGSGGASDALATEIAARQLGQQVILHGKLTRPDLLNVYGQSHLMIVPTRSTSSEGLPMVCAEAVIAGRPVITSRVSNALGALRGAVVEARQDDPQDYARRIESLADDPALYEQLVRHTASVSAQFTNADFGLVSSLEHCLIDSATKGVGSVRA